MPSETTVVGATTIPTPAGAVGDTFTDPLVGGLLAMGAWYLKDALDSKLTNLLGTSANAVPTANAFPYDPMQPRGHQIRLPVPALFMWWDDRSKRVEWTTVYQLRVRNVHMMYVFPELPAKVEMERRAGLLNSVDTAMHKMSERQCHQNYLSGAKLSYTLAAPGVVDWMYVGGQSGRFGIDEGPAAHRRAAKKSGRDWLAVKGLFEVKERIMKRTLDDPDDMADDDLIFNIDASDGESDSLVEDFMQRYLPGPDGTEHLDDE